MLQSDALVKVSLAPGLVTFLLAPGLHLADPHGSIVLCHIPQGVQRRSEGLLAWLDRHSDQLQLWGDDLPNQLLQQ